MNNNCCNSCHQCDPCGCPVPVLSIEQMKPDDLAYLRYNICGKSTSYDYEPMVKWAESDTSLRIAVDERNLIYNAEKHVDSISAHELGSILHIADIGDVDITDLQDNSLFVYQKESNCGEGCEGINNSWIAWNAQDFLTDSMQYIMGFDADGAPVTLNTPATTDKYHLLGWGASDKIKYIDPVEVAAPSADTDNFAQLIFRDPTNGQLTYLKVVVSIDPNTGAVTFSTQGGNNA